MQELGLEFILEAATARSSAVQRNQAVAHVSSDIVLFIDDDSLLLPDCAENLLSRFDADVEQQIAGIALTNVENLPPAAMAILNPGGNLSVSEPVIAKKRGGTAAHRSTLNSLEQFRLWRFFRREILMQAMDRQFVPYDHRRKRL